MKLWSHLPAQHLAPKFSIHHRTIACLSEVLYPSGILTKWSIMAMMMNPEWFCQYIFDRFYFDRIYFELFHSRSGIFWAAPPRSSGQGRFLLYIISYFSRLVKGFLDLASNLSGFCWRCLKGIRRFTTGTSAGLSISSRLCSAIISSIFMQVFISLWQWSGIATLWSSPPRFSGQGRFLLYIIAYAAGGVKRFFATAYINPATWDHFPDKP